MQHYKDTLPTHPPLERKLSGIFPIAKSADQTKSHSLRQVLLYHFISATRAVDAVFLVLTVLKEEYTPWKYQTL